MPCSATRRAAAIAAWLACFPLAAPTAQLPTPTAPSGTLRIELRGDFAPVGSIWRDGSRRPLGTLVSTTGAVDANATALVSEVDDRIAAIVGSPVGDGSLGRVDAVAEWQRGAGTIGLAFGLNRRITLYGNLPIVSTRTQVEFGFTPEGASLGLNPADLVLGNPAGSGMTTGFFAAYDAALTELATRVERGDYASDPARLALAQRTLGSSPALRARLFELLADPLLSSPVLPTESSVAGAALLSRIAAETATFRDDLGIPFDGAPALPGTPLDTGTFDALLDAGTAFGFTPRNVAPTVSIGDVELGVVLDAFRRGSSAGGVAGWVRAGARLPTGTAPLATAWLDQGSGDGQMDIEVAGIVEVSRGRIGLRAEGNYTRQLAGDVETRIGALGSLTPARFRAAVRRDPGDIVSLTATPYFRLAPRLAVTGMFRYVRRGDDAVALVEGQAPIPGADVATLAAGTGFSATRFGIGLSYAHDGRRRDGTAAMPVEASLAIERTISARSGLVPDEMVSRVMFRVYKRVAGR